MQSILANSVPGRNDLRSTTGREKSLETKHLEALGTDSLGTVHQSQSRYQELEILYEDALADSEKLLGPEHPDTLHNQALGRYREAERMHQEAVTEMAEVLGPEHSNTLAASNHITIVYTLRSGDEQAVKLFRQTQTGGVKLQGFEQPDTLWTKDYLAPTYNSQGRYVEAETLYSFPNGAPNTCEMCTNTRCSNEVVVDTSPHEREQSSRATSACLDFKDGAANHTGCDDVACINDAASVKEILPTSTFIPYTGNGDARDYYRVESNGQIQLHHILQPAYHSDYDLRSCPEATWEKTFDVINEWTQDISAPNILWLKGSAETGKSTIASGLISRLAKRGRLCSSLMLSNPAALCRTVLRDLAQYDTSFTSILVSVLHSGMGDPGRPDVTSYFESLVTEPFTTMHEHSQLAAIGTIIIIDTSNQVGIHPPQAGQQRALLDILARWSRMPGAFRLIVIGRGEHVPELFRGCCRQMELPTAAEVNIDSRQQAQLLLKQPVLRHTLATWITLAVEAAKLFIWAEVVDRVLDDDLRALVTFNKLDGQTFGLLCSFNQPLGGVSSVGHIRASHLSFADFVQQSGSYTEGDNESHKKSKMCFSLVKERVKFCVYDLPKRIAKNVRRQLLYQRLGDHIRDMTSGRGQRTVLIKYIKDLWAHVMEPHGRCPPATSHKSTHPGVAETGKIKGYTTSVSCIANVPASNRIVSVSSDNRPISVDETGEMIFNSIQGNTDCINAVANSPDSGPLVNVSYDTSNRIRGAKTVCSSFQSHPNHTSSVAVSPDRQDDIESSDGKNILLDLEIIQMVAGGHTEPVTRSPQGGNDILGSPDNTVLVRELETAQTVSGPSLSHTGHFGSGAYSPNGNPGSSGLTVSMWDLEPRNVFSTYVEGHTGKVKPIILPSDGKQIVSGLGQSSHMGAADTASLSFGPFHTDCVRSVAYSPDGKEAVSDSRFRIWDPFEQTSEVRSGINGRSPALCVETGEMAFRSFHRNPVKSLEFSPHVEGIVSGSDYKSICDDGTCAARLLHERTGNIILDPDRIPRHSSENKSSTTNPLCRNHFPNQKHLGNDSFGKLWDGYPRYRFTQNHLRFLSTFADVQGQPGWIFPTAGKILVNITQTEDIDTWNGQVEGSEERGMFLSNSVEPAWPQPISHVQCPTRLLRMAHSL